MITKPLISVEEVRSMLPVRNGDVKHDSRLLLLTTVASQQIESHTRRSFTRQTHVEIKSTRNNVEGFYDFGSSTNEDGVYYDSKAERFALRGFPVDITQPLTIYYDPTRAFAAETLVPPANYYVDDQRGVIVVKYPTREARNSLQITYTSGYEIDAATDTLTESAPADLKLACIAQVLYLWDRITPENVGMEREGSAANGRLVRIMARDGLTPEASGLIARYRQPMMGMV